MAIGSSVTFRPSSWTDFSDPARMRAAVSVTGEVVQLNEPHRWFRVRYFINDRPCYECFKF